MTTPEKHRFVVETDRATHNQLKAVAAEKETSVRGLVRSYIKAGLAVDVRKAARRAS